MPPEMMTFRAVELPDSSSLVPLGDSPVNGPPRTALIVRSPLGRNRCWSWGIGEFR